MFSIFIRELEYYFNNLKEVIVISLLFISVTLAVPFAFPAEQGPPYGVSNLILWVALLCAVQLGASHSWTRHHESGELELMPLLPWLPEWTVFGKSLAFYLLMVAQILVIVPLASLWLEIPQIRWLQWIVGLSAGALGLTFLNQMAAGLMAGQKKAGAVLGLVVLPFAIPVIIFGTGYMRQSALWHENLLFLIGYALFLWPIHCVAVGSSLRHGH